MGVELPFFGLVRAGHESRSGVGLLSFNFLILIFVGVVLPHRKFLWS